jgi:hypothetical protein
MIIDVHEGGSDRVELTEVLIKEGVTYQECKTKTVRELGTASYRRVEIQANLPEVIPMPVEYTQGDVEARAWRLPSGRLIISGMDGNLEQIASLLLR